MSRPGRAFLPIRCLIAGGPARLACLLLLPLLAQLALLTSCAPGPELAERPRDLTPGEAGEPKAPAPVADRTTYYLDCGAGNDDNSGLDKSHPWATLSHASQAELRPGDALRLRRNCAWTGPLLAPWSGTAAEPITIGAYDSGTLPLIQNASPFQVRVTGSYLTLDSLWVRSDPDYVDASCNNNRIGYRLGFYLDSGSAFNVVQNSVMSELGGGLEVASGSHHNIIRHNEFSHNNMMYDSNQSANDGGATGIVMFGDNNEMSYNVLHDQVACSRKFDGGIIGHGFDVEWGENNVYHHNQAWSNGGNFAELGAYDKTHQAVNTLFAYNVVINNGVTNHDNARGTRVYNNVFYSPNGGIISCGACSPSSMSLMNNIFYGSTGIYADGPVDENHNIFWNSGNSVYNTQPLSSSSRIVDPQFVNPTVGDFHLRPSSPARDAGTSEVLTSGVNVDFDGKPVALSGPWAIGPFAR